MNELEREDELQAHLERRSRLQRTLTEIDHLEPPQELDRIVLSRARFAIEGTEGMPLYRSLRSSLPFALAASLVLTIIVVFATHPRSRPERTASAAAAVVTNTMDSHAPGRQLARAPAQSPPVPLALPAPAQVGAAKQAPSTDRLVATRAAAANLQAPAARDATAWLKDIRELRRSGRNADAEREWAAFLKAHPEYDRSGHCAPGELC
jgi:hypothetical protein